MIRFSRYWIALCSVIIIVGMLAGCGDRSGKVSPGDQIPQFSLPGIDGTNYTHDSITEDGKRTIVAIFATWCGPCQGELRQLQEDIGTDHNYYNVVAIGTGEEKEMVKEFADRLGLQFPVIPDPDSDFAKAVGVKGIPMSLMVDSKGKIVSVHVGYDSSLIKKWANNEE